MLPFPEMLVTFVFIGGRNADAFVEFLFQGRIAFAGAFAFQRTSDVHVLLANRRDVFQTVAFSRTKFFVPFLAVFGRLRFPSVFQTASHFFPVGRDRTNGRVLRLLRQGPSLVMRAFLLLVFLVLSRPSVVVRRRGVIGRLLLETLFHCRLAFLTQLLLADFYALDIGVHLLALE